MSKFVLERPNPELSYDAKKKLNNDIKCKISENFIEETV